MENENPTAGTSGLASVSSHPENAPNIFDTDSELDSSDEYDTDDSNTFGLEAPDQDPIRSVNLHTDALYRSRNPGVYNSSPIDQWLTAIILQFNRRRTQNLRLLKHRRGGGPEHGEGLELEEAIQEIAVTADWNQKYWQKPLDGDNRIKQRWLEVAKTAELIDGGNRLQVNGGERTNVFYHLKPVTLFKEKIVCKCRHNNEKIKPHHYVRIRNRRDIEKTLSNKVPVTSFGGLRNCRKCCQPFVGRSIEVPDTTWILVNEIDDNRNEVVFNDFQRKIRFGNVDWNLTYITFAGPSSREDDPVYLSLQFVGNRTFFYNGERNGGAVRTFTDPRLLRHSRIERAVYFRQA